MSIKELLVVNTIIIGMALASVPLYYKLRQLSHDKDYQTTVKTLISSLSSLKVKQVLIETENILPLTLDQNQLEAQCDKCFESILEKGIKDNLWYKKNNTTYYYSTNGNSGSTDSKYTEAGDYQVIYNPETLLLTSTQFE